MQEGKRMLVLASELGRYSGVGSVMQEAIKTARQNEEYIVMQGMRQSGKSLLGIEFADRPDIQAAMYGGLSNPLKDLAMTQMYLDELTPTRQERRHPKVSTRRSSCITVRERDKRSAKRKKAKQTKRQAR